MEPQERVRDGSIDESTGRVEAVPVKLYRTADMVTVAAPMPGLALDDIEAEVTPDGRLRLHGVLADVPDAGMLDERESKTRARTWSPSPSTTPALKRPSRSRSGPESVRWTSSCTRSPTRRRA